MFIRITAQKTIKRHCFRSSDSLQSERRESFGSGRQSACQNTRMHGIRLETIRLQQGGPAQRDICHLVVTGPTADRIQRWEDPDD